MPLEGLHGDREHAESFGSVAELYDRFRPGYPDALIDDLISVRPLDALDVGCGTGKVAVALAGRGLRVLGVDPDARMASVAHGHGIRVEVACFEDWDDAGRRFDLITSGHAWHLVEPRVGAAKAARLLRPGGAIARFWNYHAIDERLLVEFEAIYRDLAPGLHVIGRDPTGLPDAHDLFSEDPAFTDTETRTYRWRRAMTAEQWAGLVGTFGDHMRLGGERLSVLQSALSAAVQRSGQLIDVHGGTARSPRRVSQGSGRPQPFTLAAHSRLSCRLHLAPRRGFMEHAGVGAKHPTMPRIAGPIAHVIATFQPLLC